MRKEELGDFYDSDYEVRASRNPSLVLTPWCLSSRIGVGTLTRHTKYTSMHDAYAHVHKTRVSQICCAQNHPYDLAHTLPYLYPYSLTLTSTLTPTVYQMDTDEEEEEEERQREEAGAAGGVGAGSGGIVGGGGAGKMSTREASRMMVDAVLTPMQDFRAHLGLQRWGCLALVALLEVRPDDESMVATIVASGGISALLGAMSLMKDDEDVQAAGCGVLGNSQIFDPSIVRLNGTASIVAVLSAMDAFPR